MLTTRKAFTGVFECYWCGELTKYEIINACMGVSGRGTPNVYCIGNKETGKLTECGSLAKAKKTLAHWLKLETVITKENA